MNYFENDNLINDIKTASYEELNELCSVLRSELIDDVSKTGGHIASNLGVVELTVALHKVFDSPEDKIIFDVGHQSYVHKMLTGRRDKMSGLRQHGGISGFPKIAESRHDMYDSGHSGTSISAALGYAKARDLNGEDYSCVAVIGDGALTGGVAYEALNAAGSSKTPLIVVLNDNGMSIGKNVGGIAKHLQTLRTSESYLNFKEKFKSVFKNNSGILSFFRYMRDRLKSKLVPGQIFEEFGFKYYGPVDGHSFEQLIPALEAAKRLKRPVLIHVITKKGCGFEPAEQNPSKYHGVGPFDPSTANAVSIKNENSWSEVFGDALLSLAKKDNSIVAVSAAMIDATGLQSFKDLYPDRVFDAGIAEQHAVSFAAGLALNGKKPVVAIYSTFLQRAYDQILTEVCLMKLPVIFAIDRAGVTGQDGETHQGIFDIAYLSSMPNMTVLSPKDKNEMSRMLEYAISLGTPVAIRYPRGNAPEKSYSQSTFSILPELYCNGSDLALICDGNCFDEGLKASSMLKEKGIYPSLYHIKQLYPLNDEWLAKLLSKYSSIITVEDGVLSGGFGQRIAAFASSNKTGSSVLNLGWPDCFIEHGKPSELREIYKLDAASIAERTEAFLEKET